IYKALFNGYSALFQKLAAVFTYDVPFYVAAALHELHGLFDDVVVISARKALVACDEKAGKRTRELFLYVHGVEIAVLRGHVALTEYTLYLYSESFEVRTRSVEI